MERFTKNRDIGVLKSSGIIDDGIIFYCIRFMLRWPYIGRKMVGKMESVQVIRVLGLKAEIFPSLGASQGY